MPNWHVALGIGLHNTGPRQRAPDAPTTLASVAWHAVGPGARARRGPRPIARHCHKSFTSWRLRGDWTTFARMISPRSRLAFPSRLAPGFSRRRRSHCRSCRKPFWYNSWLGRGAEIDPASQRRIPALARADVAHFVGRRFGFLKENVYMATHLTKLLLLTLVLMPATVWAQAETGRITGRVVDAQGAAVAGASVTATNADTRVVRTTTTDEHGSVPSSRTSYPAPYEVKIELTGFAPVTRTTRLTVGSTANIDVSLQAWRADRNRAGHGICRAAGERQERRSRDDDHRTAASGTRRR